MLHSNIKINLQHHFYSGSHFFLLVYCSLQRYQRKERCLLGEVRCSFVLPASSKASPATFFPREVWLKTALGLLKAAAVNSFGWGFCRVVSLCFLLRSTASMCYVQTTTLWKPSKSCKIETR